MNTKIRNPWFYEKIRKYLKGVKLEEVAEEIGLSKITLYNYMIERTFPTRRSLMKLLKYFNVSEREMLTK